MISCRSSCRDTPKRDTNHPVQWCVKAEKTETQSTPPSSARRLIIIQAQTRLSEMRTTDVEPVTELGHTVNPPRVYLSPVASPDVHEETACSICLDSLCNGYGLAAPRCGHVMHEHCLRAWFDRNVRGGCPICRADATIPQD